MKPIEETHPSLCSLDSNGYKYLLYYGGMENERPPKANLAETVEIEAVQKHTIDKQVLRDWLECSMAGESHNDWQRGYWDACKELYDMLEDRE